MIASFLCQKLIFKHMKEILETLLEMAKDKHKKIYLNRFEAETGRRLTDREYQNAIIRFAMSEISNPSKSFSDMDIAMQDCMWDEFKKRSYSHNLHIL